ncbi:winged helix-turn-helix domain-containing protein [Aquimarina gracilis]|uniref:Winged helix-turn-helix domain-containing protein n=1 Tax=Aquimarina gracilis TaxID=874422 RepID=A0ABU5ZXC0_9FLAO|nr:winged helix-turn-helix domain-containing protein [Aquimarina gracilis]MEB3346505.1 winged helix-turn-helix domain-containing protein [Aquimarina gracilis]
MHTINRAKTGVTAILIIVLSIWILFSFVEKEKETYYPEKAKIILREIGNRLLLANKDSISLVLPIKQIDENEFEISFQKELSINPDSLAAITNSIINKSNLVTDHIIEVQHCKTKDVVYSYQILKTNSDTLIPCSGRILPINCYTIRILLVPKEASKIGKSIYPITTLSLLIIFISGSFILSRKNNKASEKKLKDSTKIGKYTFHMDQQILKFEDQSIPLTTKETDLLKIFYKHPNEVVKREKLAKEVWEDHGVIVGRSLDMFISKLRKKLSLDSSIKLTNVHGVGYKMEM